MLGMISMIVLDRRLAYQRMSGMQRIVTWLCIVVIVWLAVTAYGWGIGLLVAGTIVVIGLTVHRLRWAQQAAQRLYARGRGYYHEAHSVVALARMVCLARTR